LSRGQVFWLRVLALLPLPRPAASTFPAQWVVARGAGSPVTAAGTAPDSPGQAGYTGLPFARTRHQDSASR